MLNKRILVLMFLLLFLPLVGCLTPPNQTPIITSDPITAATVGVLYTYDVNATDPDGDALTYLLVTKPKGMAMYPKTGVINWTPTSAQLGNNPVSVKVSDGTLSVIQNFTIKVSTLPPVNQAPVIISTPVITATVGVTYFYDVNATDPNGDILTYSLTACPGGMVISSANGLIMWTPIAEGAYAVVVNVSDGTLSDTQGFTIVVSKPTVPIETHTITASVGTGGSISPSGNVTVKEGSDISFYIKPNTNYGIEKVLVDGVSVGTVSTYPFYNVVKDHTIHATFIAVEPEPEPELQLIGIAVDPETMTLFVKEEKAITSVTAIYEIKGLEVIIPLGSCTYYLVDEDVITVSDDGVVTAIGEGTADILVSYEDKTATLGVTVTYLAMEIIADDLLTFTADVEGEFTVGLVANSDTGKFALAYFTLPAGTILKYYIEGTVDYTWTDSVPFEVVFGPPNTGFSLCDSTFDFGVIFTTAETYLITVEVREVDTNVLLNYKVITAVVEPSKVATLSDLTSELVGIWEPGFTSAVTTYAVAVDNAVDSITFTPTATDDEATITVDGVATASGVESGSIDLNTGDNPILIVVTAEDLTEKTYTVTVTRAKSNVATLSDLILSAGDPLDPVFVPGTFVYALAVANSVETTTVTPTATDANATITVNGLPVESGVESGSIDLDVGSNVILIVVTAEDGIATETYTVTVTRAA